MLFLLVTLVLTNLLIVALAVPLLRRRVRPNWFYGFRIPATLADEHVWYEANARAVRHMIWLGGAGAVWSVIAFFIPGLTDDVYALLGLGPMIGGLIVIVIVGGRYAGRLLRERRAASR